MELKPGYKQTEVGVIPIEWAVESLQNIANIKTGPFGTLLKASEYSVGEGVPLISVREIGEGALRVDEKTPLVPLSVIRRLPGYLLNCGDIVFGRKGAVDRSALINERQTGWFLGSDGIRIRPSKSYHPAFIAWQFQRKEVQSWLLQHAIGTTMASLNQEILRRVALPLPPLPEQRAIAQALSDVDALISGLDRLIAKKRDLKQAAMQQLLTGKQRLSGFSGEWEVKHLGDIASLHRENVIPVNFPDQLFIHYSLPAYDAGKVPVIELGSTIGSNKFRVPGDVVLVSKLNPRIPRVWAPSDDINLEAISSTEFLVLKPKDSTSRSFLYVVCSSESFCEQMELLATGTTGSHQRINPIDALNIKLPVPSDADEQAAIAAVLSDMDAEITALEQRRDKTRALKQGMMQELLTGRIRLV